MPKTTVFLLIVSLLPALGGCAAEAEKGERPNVLFILVDDLGWRDLGVYGSTFYETPNVDRLAAEGMRFLQAYAAAPVCSPTRASILTGKYPVRTGITDYIDLSGANQPEHWARNTPLLPAAYANRLALEQVTLAEAFKAAGYATFFAGKWHLGPEGFWPKDQDFDVNVGGSGRGHPPTYFSPYDLPNLENGPEGEYLPYRLAEETGRFIEHHKEQPFLAFLAFYSVHTPLMTRPSLKTKYEAKKREVAPVTKWGQEGAHKVRLTQNHPVYAGMVEAMDRAVGMVLRRLEELDLEDETVVIFTSDNGGLSTSGGHPTANVPLRAGKGWLYEGGLRVPLIIKWPDVTEPGSVSNVPVVSTDVYPTLLEMAHLPLRPEQHKDGLSLVPLLKEQGTLDREAIYFHYPHYAPQGSRPGAAIRAGTFKLIMWFREGRVALYNLQHDIGEENNLAAKRPEKTAVLKERLVAWLDAVDASMPTPNPAYMARGE